MEPHNFDRLARAIGSSQSRRGVLKTLAGGAFAAITGVAARGEAGAAAKLRANGVVCSKDADCQSGVCYPRDRTGRQVCGPNQCIGLPPCQPLDECHVAGVCQPFSGICTNPLATDGTYCHRFSGTCQHGSCVLFPTLSCDACSECESHCPSSVREFCSCGRTIEGDPVCYHGDHGCAGHFCAADGDCLDLGASSTCIFNFCSTPNVYCTSSGDCGPGSSCIDLNDGCGGCDNYTGGKGICNTRCTS